MRTTSLAAVLLLVVFALAARTDVAAQISRVFVTSTTIGPQAAFGGISVADAECNARANAASLGGTWMAWLSDSTTSPAARFIQFNRPYTLVNGVMIANDWADLTDGSLLTGIGADEYGVTVSNAEVWTATFPTGASQGGSPCDDWTRNNSAPPYVYVGISGHADSTWTTVYTQFCDRNFVHLYCFEMVAPVPDPVISGTVTYVNAAAPPKVISNVLISGAGSPNVSTTTLLPGAGAGTYSLTGLGTGAYTVTPTKSTGGVNSINSFDAAKIAGHVAGLPPLLNTTQKIAADVSNNGAVNSFDAALLARYVTGPSTCTIPTCGISGTWRFFTPGPTFPVGASPTTRTYATVAGNITDQDYWGILVGEVSGNWTNTGARPANRFDAADLSWLLSADNYSLEFFLH